MKKLKKAIIPVLLSTLIGGTSVVCLANEIIQNNDKNNILNVDFSNYSEGLTYDLSEDGSYYIVSNDNYGLSDSNLVIPEEYKGLPVKEIKSEGFAYRSWINSVAIPKTIERIGSGAFNGTGLQQVYFNAKNCEDFKGRNWVFHPTSDHNKQDIAITIGKDVERIPARLFFPKSTEPDKVPNVNSVTFEENSSLKEIGDYAFYKLERIKVVNFPNTLIKLGNYAFNGAGIETLTLPTSLKEIGNHCFNNNVNLKSVNFPNTLENIGIGAFKNCKALENIVINSSIELPNEVFKHCTSLKNISLKGVTSIGNSAFENCISLVNISDYDSLINIGKSSFKNCSSLQKITLPKELKSIGKEAFYGCYSVNKIEYNSIAINDLVVGNSSFYELGKNTEGIEVIFSNEVEVIPAQLFASSSLDERLPNISKIIIYGNSLTQVRNWAFGYLAAEVTYVGTISSFKNIDILEGNITLSKVNCVENY